MYFTYEFLKYVFLNRKEFQLKFFSINLIYLKGKEKEENDI